MNTEPVTAIPPSHHAWSEHSYDTCWQFSHSGNGMNPAIAAELLLRTAQVLDAAGLEFWLAFGTCLGAIREGRFIPHDTDIDIAMRYDQRGDVMRLIDGLHFRTAGVSLVRLLDKLLCLEHQKQYLDLYFFRRGKDMYQCGGYSLEFRHVDDGLRDIVFLGRTFKVPAHTKAYLKSKYGDDWETPIKNKHAYT